MKNIRSSYYVYAVLLLLTLGSYCGIIILWHQQKNESKLLTSQINQLISNQVVMQGSNYYDVTISPASQAVYVPHAKLRLPDSALTESLAYTYKEAYSVAGSKKIFPATLSISTHDLAANAASTTQQFDCSQVAYADFVTPSYPVNPGWKPDGTIQLADGRTMNTYYAPSIPGCQAVWNINKIDSKLIADMFKQAVSY